MEKRSETVTMWLGNQTRGSFVNASVAKEWPQRGQADSRGMARRISL